MPYDKTDSDHTIDLAHVQAALRAQFPELELSEVKPLGEGWDHCAFEVNAEWVFRFPKRADSEERLMREAQALERLAPESPIPIPNYGFRGAADEHYPFSFVGYRKLPGQALLEYTPSALDLKTAAKGIGAFLDWLHRFEGFRRSEGLLLTEKEPLAAFRRDALADLKTIRDALPPHLLQACTTHLDDLSNLPEDYGGTPKLIHNDLGADHILVNQNDSKIMGVIDFGDVAFGDPAYDFGGLWLFGGDEFLEHILSSYSGPIDAHFLQRVKFVALCWALDDMNYGVETGRSHYVERGLKGLENACAAGLFSENPV